jgi:hypothetical protein
MLLDPDMVLLRPLRHDFTNEEVLWVTEPPATKVVRHGYPVSQQDGYLGLDWMGLNWSHITNRTKGQFRTPPSPKDGQRHWIAGPPYLATVKDMYDIAELWTEYSPRVLDLYDDIFAGKCWPLSTPCEVMIIHSRLSLPSPFTSRNVWVHHCGGPAEAPSHVCEVDRGVGN